MDGVCEILSILEFPNTSMGALAVGMVHDLALSLG